MLNFESFLKKHQFVQYKDKIILFLNNISKANVFKEILKEIYKNDYEHLDQNEIVYYINNNIHFFLYMIHSQFD